MSVWIALLRGINVGGNNKLPMKDLRALLDAQGFEDAQTYIQSGNAAFRSMLKSAAPIAAKIEDGIEGQFSFRPQTFVLSAAALDKAIKANPYPEGADDPKSVHFFFLEKPATEADLDGLQALAKDNERFTLTKEVFYLHAPDGIGRSKLAEKIGKHLKVVMTARNYRTVLEMQKLAAGL